MELRRNHLWTFNIRTSIQSRKPTSHCKENRRLRLRATSNRWWILRRFDKICRDVYDSWHKEKAKCKWLSILSDSNPCIANGLTDFEIWTASSSISRGHFRILWSCVLIAWLSNTSQDAFWVQAMNSDLKDRCLSRSQACHCRLAAFETHCGSYIGSCWAHEQTWFYHKLDSTFFEERQRSHHNWEVQMRNYGKIKEYECCKVWTRQINSGVKGPNFNLRLTNY